MSERMSEEDATNEILQDLFDGHEGRVILGLGPITGDEIFIEGELSNGQQFMASLILGGVEVQGDPDE